MGKIGKCHLMAENLLRMSQFLCGASLGRVNEVCINSHGHMTKMATMAMNDKNLKKIFFFRTRRPMGFGTLHEASRIGGLQNVYINNDPGMTLTYFSTRSTYVAHAFEWGKLLKCHLKGKTCSKLANVLNFQDLKRH